MKTPRTTARPGTDPVSTAPRAAASRAAPRHTAWTETATPLGPLLVARNDQGLSGLWFEGQKYHPGGVDAPRDDADPLLRDTVAVLRDYFAGKSRDASRSESPALPPMSPRGTPFQQAVWQALLAIPAGETITYGELAARLGRPEAVRAVAAAVGRNPVSVLIPCHRVVGTDGSLTGYAGGLHRKEALLTIEGGLPDTLRASPNPQKVPA
ncbi:MAG: methylated-DNA--[protein]-cysteine S-methyltransferase [Mitsuaria chitosanitabida]|uniref:methylated-DNA--[protein]-cysteine S-methyltransferase n=1 Tax=Roseateles chitosanitabidus TaxID=65048 RepID=UPI001B19C620|nr:methylated-DNA--[protein]-cysteine S-methyltransferase [Roseateles chitosanitabidus]MBO9687372.1 methylated-DNA--[protein]-cysteine S-methyltransferase [Roseateles chitosanitabidus]